jgi:hypothetical protein
MKRIHAKPLFAAALAVLINGATFSMPAQARAIKLWEQLTDDGEVDIEFYETESKKYFMVMISAEGVATVAIFPDEDNPEADSTGPGSHTSAPDVVHLIEVGDATYKVRIVPADSAELLGHLKNGGGLGPVYNPSDDDNGNGHGDAPDHSMEVKKTAAEIREQIRVANIIANDLATLEGSMGDGDEGGGESPTGFNTDGSPGGTGDDEGDYTEGQNKTIGKTEKDLLGAKPDVVNPPHWGSDTATHGAGRSATGGADGGGGAGGSNAGGSARSAASTHG